MNQVPYSMNPQMHRQTPQFMQPIQMFPPVQKMGPMSSNFMQVQTPGGYYQPNPQQQVQPQPVFQQQSIQQQPLTQGTGTDPMQLDNSNSIQQRQPQPQRFTQWAPTLQQQPMMRQVRVQNYMSPIYRPSQPMVQNYSYGTGVVQPQSNGGTRYVNYYKPPTQQQTPIQQKVLVNSKYKMPPSFQKRLPKQSVVARWNTFGIKLNAPNLKYSQNVSSYNGGSIGSVSNQMPGGTPIDPKKIKRSTSIPSSEGQATVDFGADFDFQKFCFVFNHKPGPAQDYVIQNFWNEKFSWDALIPQQSQLTGQSHYASGIPMETTEFPLAFLKQNIGESKLNALQFDTTYGLHVDGSWISFFANEKGTRALDWEHAKMKFGDYEIDAQAFATPHKSIMHWKEYMKGSLVFGGASSRWPWDSQDAGKPFSRYVAQAIQFVTYTKQVEAFIDFQKKLVVKTILATPNQREDHMERFVGQESNTIMGYLDDSVHQTSAIFQRMPRPIHELLHISDSWIISYNPTFVKGEDLNAPPARALMVSRDIIQKLIDKDKNNLYLYTGNSKLGLRGFGELPILKFYKIKGTLVFPVDKFKAKETANVIDLLRSNKQDFTKNWFPAGEKGKCYDFEKDGYIYIKNLKKKTISKIHCCDMLRASVSIRTLFDMGGARRDGDGGRERTIGKLVNMYYGKDRNDQDEYWKSVTHSFFNTCDENYEKLVEKIRTLVERETLVVKYIPGLTGIDSSAEIQERYQSMGHFMGGDGDRWTDLTTRFLDLIDDISKLQRALGTNNREAGKFEKVHILYYLLGKKLFKKLILSVNGPVGVVGRVDTLPTEANWKNQAQIWDFLRTFLHGLVVDPASFAKATTGIPGTTAFIHIDATGDTIVQAIESTAPDFVTNGNTPDADAMKDLGKLLNGILSVVQITHMKIFYETFRKYNIKFTFFLGFFREMLSETDSLIYSKQEALTVLKGPTFSNWIKDDVTKEVHLDIEMATGVKVHDKNDYLLILDANYRKPLGVCIPGIEFYPEGKKFDRHPGTWKTSGGLIIPVLLTKKQFHYWKEEPVSALTGTFAEKYSRIIDDANLKKRHCRPIGTHAHFIKFNRASKGFDIYESFRYHKKKIIRPEENVYAGFQRTYDWAQKKWTVAQTTTGHQYFVFREFMRTIDQNYPVPK